ncbi:hypothetical protein NDU88_001786 [Pleurodeles waltl]|uniref:Uncharacterized protein n=1 Tax=Pleurodeles waltl TaxID=8319 RepID=A0AAV7MPG3_PLEWA|nr:hypothetical protein NDU88_001786 [Pleurodeles waltl]
MYCSLVTYSSTVLSADVYCGESSFLPEIISHFILSLTQLTLLLAKGQVADFPATSNAESKAERRSGGLAETESNETGNSPIQIPEDLPENGRAEEGKTTRAGNLDIRVPESLKSKEGLRAGRTDREEDAEERGASNLGKEDSGGDKGTNDPYLGERRPFNGRDHTSEGWDGPKKPEFCHVPGGMWLKQEGKTAGNPDIRVPESLKSKEGLRVGRADGEEDAEEKGVENLGKEDSGGDKGTNDPYLGERWPFNGQDDASEGQDGPKKPEFQLAHKDTTYLSFIPLFPVFLTKPPPGDHLQSPGTLRKKRTEEITRQKDHRYRLL